MYHRWIEWQEEAGLQSWLNVLRYKRKKALFEVLCLQHQAGRERKRLARTEAFISKALEEHKALDEEMSLHDGRLIVISTEPKITKKKKGSIEDTISKMSKEEKLSLIEVLKKMP
jgi:hypothetical protein